MHSACPAEGGEEPVEVIGMILQRVAGEAALLEPMAIMLECWVTRPQSLQALSKDSQPGDLQRLHSSLRTSCKLPVSCQLTEAQPLSGRHESRCTKQTSCAHTARELVC